MRIMSEFKKNILNEKNIDDANAIIYRVKKMVEISIFQLFTRFNWKL